jgi:tetratricopeptide (TPR) repeat protein
MDDGDHDDRFAEDGRLSPGGDRFDDDERVTKAHELFQQAYELQVARKFADAIRLYKQSIEVYPTAEAHTFLGWTYSFQGRLDEAIQECQRAIEVDPDFGNPYNDIGVYLMHKGEYEEALPWLRRAKQAARYEPRHFPYLNTGRIYLARGEWLEALREFEKAVELMPDDPGARRALAGLRGRLN